MQSGRLSSLVCVVILLSWLSVLKAVSAEVAGGGAEERHLELKKQLGDALKEHHLAAVAAGSSPDVASKFRASRRARHSCREDYLSLCQDYIPEILQSNQDDNGRRIGVGRAGGGVGSTVARAAAAATEEEDNNGWLKAPPKVGGGGVTTQTDAPLVGHAHLGWGEAAQERAGKAMKKMADFEKEAAAHAAKRALSRKRKTIGFLNKYAVANSETYNSLKVADFCLAEKVKSISNPSCKEYIISRNRCLAEAAVSDACLKYVGAPVRGVNGGVGDAVPNDVLIERQRQAVLREQGAPKEGVIGGGGAPNNGVIELSTNMKTSASKSSPAQIEGQVKCLRNVDASNFGSRCTESIYYAGLRRN